MKRLIVCLDGTWNTPDHPGKVTNVVRIMRALRPHGDQGVPQVVFYDKGVGTGGPIDKLQGGAFGRGLDDNLKDGYRFIANNYVPGDEIYIFGFSRGAFTARSLAGFIGWMGMLRKHHLEHLTAAYRSYRSRDTETRDALRGSHGWDVDPVRIRCVGVWDTVGALGVPLKLTNFSNRKYQYHDTQLGTHIDHAFHALAIDEKRGPFEPTLWQMPEDQDEDTERVQQVWFPGVHSNIGGSYPDQGLSDLALSWMIDRVSGATGLSFDPVYRKAHIAPDPCGTQYDSLGKYVLSRAVPFHRTIGGRDECVGWLARRLKRFNRPKPGFRYVNEMIHRSALERLDQEVPVQKGGKVERLIYRPANLLAAKDALPVVEYDGSITGA